MQNIITQLAAELNETQAHVKNVVELLDGGSTVPFIARYRKELTGSMDDQQIRKLADRLAYLRGLQQRREEVKTAIAAQEKLTEALEKKIPAMIRNTATKGMINFATITAQIGINDKRNVRKKRKCLKQFII